MRLTKKTDIGIYESRKHQEDWANLGETNQKLGPLEDIEEKLGIDLVTLLKALREGIALEGEKQAKPCQLRMFCEEPMLIVDNMDSTYSEVYVKGYGESWALANEGFGRDQGEWEGRR